MKKAKSLCIENFKIDKLHDIARENERRHKIFQI